MSQERGRRFGHRAIEFTQNRKGPQPKGRVVQITAAHTARKTTVFALSVQEVLGV